MLTEVEMEAGYSQTELAHPDVNSDVEYHHANVTTDWFSCLLTSASDIMSLPQLSLSMTMVKTLPLGTNFEVVDHIVTRCSPE